MKKLTTLITILFFISNGIFAQLGEIKGFVKDEKTGEPLFGATVYIETAGNKVGDASDPDGKYTIKPVNVGTHVVFVSVLGYKKIKITDVLVTSDKITYVDVNMEKAVTEFDEFVVEEERYIIPLLDKGQPGIQHVLPKELKNSVNRNDPIKIVTNLPGVTLAPNGKDVYIRGSRPSSTQFVTDGMKSITGDIGIPGQAIGSIKVYTGGVPSKYGDVSGGVIVVETKSYFDLAQEYK